MKVGSPACTRSCAVPHQHQFEVGFCVLSATELTPLLPAGSAVGGKPVECGRGVHPMHPTWALACSHAINDINELVRILPIVSQRLLCDAVRARSLQWPTAERVGCICGNSWVCRDRGVGCLGEYSPLVGPLLALGVGHYPPGCLALWGLRGNSCVLCLNQR